MEVMKDEVTCVSEEEMKQVMEWVQMGRAHQRKTINTRISSYGLKHLIERDMGTYISNDSCIEAFKRMGFTVKPILRTPNFYFNIGLSKEQ